MAEVTFPVLPARRRRKLVHALGYTLAGLVAGWLALYTNHWLWWALTGILIGLAAGKLISLLRMRNVARVDASGVTIWLPTGREMQARWGEIEAHTIDPEKALGGIIVRAGSGGRVRVLPIATRDMGPEAAGELIAALKERLPKLAYRVPTMGRR